MESKLFEVRDRSTFTEVLATKMGSDNAKEKFLLQRSGFIQPGYLVLLTNLSTQESSYSRYNWTVGRTMGEAHRYIAHHFDDLTTGDVIDIEYILGESEVCKESERLSY